MPEINIGTSFDAFMEFLMQLYTSICELFGIEQEAFDPDAE